MKTIRNSTYFLIVLMFLFCQCKDSRVVNEDIEIVSSDLSNFYDAYDNIIQTNDTIKQKEYLQSLFLNKASKGQKKMIELRNYSTEDYLKAIEAFPNFWKTLRPNTLKIESHNKAIKKGIAKLKIAYPEMKESTVYYTVGAFRSPGTGIKDFVLLGSEYALGGPEVELQEFKGVRDNMLVYYDIYPISQLESLVTHEYVHSLQNQPPYNLLSQCLYEGIGELIGTELSGIPTPWVFFDYGKKNESFVFKKFEEEMFDTRNFGNWLWNDTNNIFGNRDVGYYVGYKIAKTYYDNSEDKKLAIKELIELDYENEDEVERIVDGTKVFSKTLEEMYQTYENERPKVIGIKQFENGNQEVDTSIKIVTIQFSEPMNHNHRGFDFGPLGKDAALIMTKYIGFSKDSTEVSFEVNLEPNKKYQLQLSSKFMDVSGYYTRPYLIEFKTK